MLFRITYLIYIYMYIRRPGRGRPTRLGHAPALSGDVYSKCRCICIYI